jgi:D-serine deaminase-like pyridoxal phosphate-dependent protein
MNTDALQALSDQQLDWRVKSAPGDPIHLRISDLVAARSTLFDAGFLPPVMTLRDSALTDNIAEMAAFCARSGVQLAPHGKTHMSPQLAARQLAAGAWGITVANGSQARVYRAFGVQRIFCANELADRATIGWVARELEADPTFTFVCYVDSVAGVQLLAETLAEVPGARPIDVVVELGFLGGRTGCRSLDVAVAVAKQVVATPRLRLSGVAGFEGGIGHGDEPDSGSIAQVREFLGLIREAGSVIAQIADLQAPFYVSAGGSAYFDLVVDELMGDWYGSREPTVLMRSGCYLIHDDGYYLRQTPFGRTIAGALRESLQLWGVVLSTPEPGLALVGVGRRDTSFDMDLPTPELIRRADGSVTSAEGLAMTGLDDQHGYLRLDTGVEVEVGDWVAFGISHPCTAMDKWQLVVVVDDDDRVIDCIRTFF